MISRFFKKLPTAFTLVMLSVLAFSGVAAGATEVNPEGSAWFLDQLRILFEAFASHNYGLTGMLTVILVVAVAKRWAPGKLGAFLHGNTGGTLLVLVGAAATSGSVALAVPEAHLTLPLLKTSLWTGVMAAGGYAVLKNLVVEPLLRPLAALAPAWLTRVFDALLWAFSHVGADPVVEAQEAGTHALESTPSTGVGGVIGKPKDVP